MPVYRKCTECGKKVLEYTLCKCEEKKKLDSYKDYKRRRMMDKGEKERQKFYSSDSWIKCRDNIISNCYGLDIVEYYKTGEIVHGNTVHHIVELSECWDRRLDANNLIYLTYINHSRVHIEYNKGDKEKKALQRLLIELKARFFEEFS